MGAGVSHAGYGIGNGIRVFNNTANVLKAGESVDWDPTQAATDGALRVRRPTADASVAYAGVVLQDIPANGGYGDLQVAGEVDARVDSTVTAGAVLVGDFVTGAICRLRPMGVGDFAACAVARTAAVETPSGSGVFWAKVALLGLNGAAIQATMRGGNIAKKNCNHTGLGAAATFTRQLSALYGHAVSGIEILSDTAIGGADAGNCWTIQITRNGGATLLAVAFDLRAGFVLGDFSIAAGTVKSIGSALMQNTVSAVPCLYTVTITKVGVPVPTADLSTANISLNLVLDPGVIIPMAFGRG